MKPRNRQTETPAEVQLPPRKLPPGWRWVKLGEVCKHPTETRDPGKTPNAEFRYVDISSVDNGAKRIVAATVLKGADAPSRARQVIRTGDVIVATTRPNLNAVAVVPAELNNQVCSTGFCVLRPTDDVATDWLFAYVRAPEFVDALSDLVKGALYPAVSDKQVFAQDTPLPPLPEQRRIAGILNEQMQEVEKARKATEAQLEAARALPAAYLRGVFDSEEAKKWPRRKFGDVASIVACQVDPKEQEYGALPHVSAENIESGRCRLLYINSAAHDGMISGKYLFEPEDVLYSKLRPYLRKAMVADYRGVCSADMYPVRVDRNTLDPHFTAWTLVADEFTKYADSESRRARMPKLNRDQLFAWAMPVPSLARQQEVAGLLTGEFESTENTRQRIEAQLETINRLPAALLRKAFAGEV